MKEQVKRAEAERQRLVREVVKRAEAEGQRHERGGE